MAETYQLSGARRFVNVVIKPLARLGWAGPHTYVLTVRGRKTGKLYETPVTLIENGERWLVAPYGEVGWVRNARAAGEVQLCRKRRSETLQIAEVAPTAAAPVLRRYLQQVRVVRPFFDVTPTSPIAAFEGEASRHPVFRLTTDSSS
jgi:deazaflavin-dependent oxidoreductase (nitroreductase family)